MMKVCYSELDGPEGLSCRLEAAGHAGFAPAGQDIVCAGASTLMQALVYLLAGEENAHADAWEEPDGPRLAVQADAPCAAWVQGAFELAKAGFTLLAERYPDNVRFADVSRRGEQSMMDLQMFAESSAAPAAPALSHGTGPAGRRLRDHENRRGQQKLRSRCRKQNRIRSRPNRRRPQRRSCPAPAVACPCRCRPERTRCGSCMPAGRQRKPTMRRSQPELPPAGRS